MIESNAPLPSDRSNPENIALEDSLILKDPLLVASPLGINRQFLVPLGAHSLTILDPHIFQQQSAHSEASLFQDSPFFNDRSSAESESKQTTQPASIAANEPVIAAIIQKSPTLPKRSLANSPTNKTLQAKEHPFTPTLTPHATNQSKEANCLPLTSLEQQTQASASLQLEHPSTSEFHSLPELASFDEKLTLQGKLTAQKPELHSSDESVQRSPEVLSSTAAIVQGDSRSIPHSSTAVQTEGSTNLIAQNDGHEMPSSEVSASETDIPQAQSFHQQTLPVSAGTIAPLSDHSTPSSNQTAHESLPIQTSEKGALDALSVQRSLAVDEASNRALPSFQLNQELNQAAVSPSSIQTESIPIQTYPASLAKESEVVVKTSQSTLEIVTSIASTPVIQPAPLVPTQTTNLAGATTQTIDTLGLESSPDQTTQSSVEVQPEALSRSVALPTDVSQPTSISAQIELSPQRLQAATTLQSAISTSLDQPLQRQNVNPLEAAQAYQLDDSEAAQTVSQTDSQAAITSTISRSITNTTNADLTSTSNTQSSTLPPHGLEATDISFSKHSNASNTGIAFESVVTKASSPSLQNSFNSLVLEQPSEQLTSLPAIQASTTSLPIEPSTNTASDPLASQDHPYENDYKPILPDTLTHLKPQQAAVESSDSKTPAPQLIQQESPVKAIVSQATQWLSRAVTLFAGTEAKVGEEKTSDHSLAPLQQANFENQIDQPVDSFQQPSSHSDLGAALAPLDKLKSPQQAGETTELQLKANLPLAPNVATEANTLKLDTPTVKNTGSTSAVVAEIALEGRVQPLVNTIDIPKAELPKARVAKTEVAQLSLSKELAIPLVNETLPEVELQRASEPFSEAISEKIGFIDHSIQPTDAADLKQPSSDSKPLKIATAIDQIVSKATLQRTSESSQLESIELITSPSGERLAKLDSPSLKTGINAEETASIRLEKISAFNSSEANSEVMSDHPAISSEAIAAKANANVSHTASEKGLATNLETNSGTSIKTELDASSISNHTVSTTEIGLQRAYQTSEEFVSNRSETAIETDPNPSIEINLDQPDVTDHASPTELELQKAAQPSDPSENTSNQSDRWQEATLQPHLEASGQSTLETQLNSITSVSNIDGLTSTVARSIEQPLKEDTFTAAAIDSASLDSLQLTSGSVDEASKSPVVDADSVTTVALTTAEVLQPHINEHTNEQETLLLDRHSDPLHSTIETLQAPNNVFDPPSLQLDANAALSVQTALTTNAEAVPEALVEQKQQTPILPPVNVDAQTEVAIQAAPNLFDQVSQLRTAEAVAQALPETVNEQLPLLEAESHHSTLEATIVQRDITNHNLSESANHSSSQALQLNSSKPSDLPKPSEPSKPLNLADEPVVVQTDLITETPFSRTEKSSAAEFISAKAEAIPSEDLTHDSLLIEQPAQLSSSNAIQALSASSLVDQAVQATSETARSSSEIENAHSASRSEITPSTLSEPNELIQASTATPEVLTETLGQPTSLAEAIVQPFSSLSKQASVSEPLTSTAQATSNIERTHLFSSSTEVVQSDTAQNLKPEPLLAERSPSETEYIQAKSKSAASTQYLETLSPTNVSSSEPPSLATLPIVEAPFSSETLPLASPDLAPPTATQPINSVQTDATLQLKSMQATAMQSTEAVAADWQQPQESSTKPLAVETTNQTIAETTIAQSPNRSIIQPATATAQEAASIETVLAQAAVSLQSDAALSANPSHAAQRQVQPPSPVEAALKVEDANVIAPQAELSLVTQSLSELSTSEQVQLRTAPAPEITTDPVETSEMTAQFAKSDVTVLQPEMPTLQASVLPVIEPADRVVATQTTLPTLQAAAETSAVLLAENAALEKTEKQQVTEDIEPVTSAENAIVQRLPNDASVNQAIAFSTEEIESTALETAAIVQRLPNDALGEQAIAFSTEEIEPTALETAAIVQRLPNDASVNQAIAFSTKEIESTALETAAIVQRLPNNAPGEQAIAFSTEGIEPTALETAIVQRIPNDALGEQAIALPTSIEPTAFESAAIVQRLPSNNAPVEQAIAFFAEGIEPTALEPTAIVQRLPNDALGEQAIAFSTEEIESTALETAAIVQRLPNDASVNQAIAFSTEEIESTALETAAIVQRLPNNAPVEQPIAPSELASVTALRQPETAPQLPLVLQTLTTLQPLSDRLNHASAAQASIVQASTANTLHRSPTQVATTSPAQPSIDQQKVIVNRTTSQWTDFSNLVQGQTKPSPRSGRSTVRDGSTMDSTGAGSLIQAKLNEGTEVIRLSSNAQLGMAEAVEAEAAASVDYLETLAQEIYQRLRQRLRVEQERQGRDYAGRLPW